METKRSEKGQYIHVFFYPNSDIWSPDTTNPNPPHTHTHTHLETYHQIEKSPIQQASYHFPAHLHWLLYS